MGEQYLGSRRGRLLATLRVQYPDTLSEAGYQLLHPRTGDPYSNNRRHLVATCRAVSNFSIGNLIDGPDWCLNAAKHGLTFLHNGHRAEESDGYYFVVDETGKPLDETRSAYGHAFVLLAYSRATAAGLDGAREGLDEIVEVIDSRLRDKTGLLRSDCDPDWDEQAPYRGQNANMHACEAYIAAYEATGDQRFLDRAGLIAEKITIDLAAETNGLLWEHYTNEWRHDFEYNQEHPRHQFRPPGYQPGHHAEWAKLLALLDRYNNGDGISESGWYGRAVELFDAAVNLGWTGNGFAYTVEAGGEPIVPDRYGWALAEAIGAVAALAERASAHGHENAVERFHSWERKFVTCADQYRGPAGLWYEKRLPETEGGEHVAPGPPGVEPDYHPVSAWYESWRSGREVITREQ